jgi:hypothetical protein
VSRTFTLTAPPSSELVADALTKATLESPDSAGGSSPDPPPPLHAPRASTAVEQVKARATRCAPESERCMKKAPSEVLTDGAASTSRGAVLNRAA